MRSIPFSLSLFSCLHFPFAQLFSLIEIVLFERFLLCVLFLFPRLYFHECNIFWRALEVCRASFLLCFFLLSEVNLPYTLPPLNTTLVSDAREHWAFSLLFHLTWIVRAVSGVSCCRMVVIATIFPENESMRKTTEMNRAKRVGAGGGLQLQYVLPITDWDFLDVFSWHFMLMRLNSPENEMKKKLYSSQIFWITHTDAGGAVGVGFLKVVSIHPFCSYSFYVCWNTLFHLKWITDVRQMDEMREKVRIKSKRWIKTYSVQLVFNVSTVRRYLFVRFDGVLFPLSSVPHPFCAKPKKGAKVSITLQLLAASEFHVFANALWIKSH